MEKTRKSKRAVSVLSTVLLIIAVLLLVYVLGARVVGGTPRLFGYSFHVVVTGSMSPEIEPGDLIVSKKTAESNIKIGDDILFVTRDPRLNGMTIVHRVVGITENGEFVTKGVRPGLEQDEYTAVNPIGVVVAKNRTLGRVLSFIGKGRDVVFIVMMVVILAFIVTEIFNLAAIVREKRDADRKEK